MLLSSPAVIDTFYAEHPETGSEACVTIYNKTQFVKMVILRLPWMVKMLLKWPELFWNDQRIKEGLRRRQGARGVCRMAVAGCRSSAARPRGRQAASENFENVGGLRGDYVRKSEKKCGKM